jgi:predicted O-methyltransferase YrrM
MSLDRKTAFQILTSVAACAAIVALLLLLRAYHHRSQPANAGLDPQSREVVAALPPPFSQLLLSMHDHELQIGTDGTKHGLAALVGVAAADGAYIYDICKKVKPHHTLEVGFAEGFSTMYFMAAIKANGGGFHVAIDPFENTQWHGLGLEKIQEAGMKEKFRFMEAKSVSALPVLNSEAASFEIIFIDGDHRFDGTFTDFVLSDPICAKGGYILFHDVQLESTKKVLSFLERNRSDYMRRSVPKNVNIAAFQKIGDDRRDWLHFVNF